MKVDLKTVVSKAFHTGMWAVGCYLWPIGWKTKDKTLKRLFCGLAAGAALHPMIGRALFPSAEDVLASRGLDPAAVQRLTDQSVRVAKPGLKARFYYSTSTPGWPLMALNWFSHAKTEQRSGYGVFAIPSIYTRSLLNPLKHTPLDLGMISIEERIPDIKQIMAYALGVRKEEIERMPLSAEDFTDFMVCHEIRHTAFIQQDLAPIPAEADADFGALKESCHPSSRKLLAPAFQYFRLPLHIFVSPDHENNIALHVDALLTGIDPPAIEEAIEAVWQAEDIYNNIPSQELIASREQSFGLQKAINFRYQLQHHPEKFTDLSYRYVKMFVGAREYFMPAAMGIKPGAQHKSAGHGQPVPHS